jgi:hypothetical protein
MRSIANNILYGASEALERGLDTALQYLDKPFYPETNERVELIFTARDCCRLVGTQAVKASLPVGSYPLRDALTAAMAEVRQGMQALDDLMEDPRIDVLMRGRAKAARASMGFAVFAAQMRLNQYAALMVAADALEGVAP